MARRRKKEKQTWFTYKGTIIDIPPWVPPTPDLPDDPLAAMLGLRQMAIETWDDLAMMFGTCVELMAKQYVSVKEHRMMADCLLYLELFVRRVVMIAALAYASLKPARPSQGPWGAPRLRRELWYDPTSWRVSFSMLRGPWRKRQKRRSDKPPSRDRSTRALCRRIEAIRRVLSYIPGYAKRFARRMQRLRAHNAKANQPRRIELAGWDFHPDRRTLGKWGVNDAMTVAQPLAEIAVNILQEPG